MKQKDFLAALDAARITAAIETAEKRTSGEIRVHIQPKSHGNIREVAERTFERLGMTKTDLRNGVLLFIASEEQKFVILGDHGIDEKVPPHFWDEIAANLTQCFREGRFTDGIVDAIHTAGEELARDFPYGQGDRNELTNEISVDH
jgi:uncharacterized membrane protein